ncbi:endonuclease/exonuclease/phosphatase family protein [Christiangramia echinicola]|uniref:Metal-dependent hydrolase, endonuclease/exonuclease/phosphatase family n=1 Tax=Christiangramia echinicola TaxID=279359 RepID=A0A1H1PLN9_9FLAO|nr:endonuclease/exonuclease/phosphatase family protein [Christiangramia echinicola]SDS12148.1 Metal-dependent hydrolase, endonuclease/exonuclease/phosphatase family [Christiangramia echinicola]
MKNRFFIFFLLFMQATLYSQQLELMTYNIKYANENDGENSWSNRQDWITDQIKFYEPDILGVQEAVIMQIDHFSTNMPQYKYVGIGREGENKGEFSAIFYNKDKFEVLHNETFWLSETPSEISKGWDAAFNRVCTYALFQNMETQEKFYVFNTHFDHVGKEARVNSARLIIRKIKELNKEDLPVFLMGDFNLEPDSEGIQLLSGHLDKSREKAEMSFGPVGTFNGYNFNEPVNRRIDYIFTNNKVKVKKYAVLTDSKELRYPSDHFPVMIIAELKK